MPSPPSSPVAAVERRRWGVMKSVFVIRVVGLACLATGALRLWNGEQQPFAEAGVGVAEPATAPRLPREQIGRAHV